MTAPADVPRKRSNTEVLATPVMDLSPMDTQRRFTLNAVRSPSPCPVCGYMQTRLDASGLALDEFPTDPIGTPWKFLTYTCVSCDTPLAWVEPRADRGWVTQAAVRALRAASRRPRAEGRADETPE